MSIHADLVTGDLSSPEPRQGLNFVCVWEELTSKAAKKDLKQEAGGTSSSKSSEKEKDGKDGKQDKCLIM